MAIATHPLTPERWPDIETLFGPRGACAGCWCMYWRQRAPEWKARSKGSNKPLFRAVVEHGPPPGLIAYVDGVPAGWVQVGPHAGFARLLASRTKQPEAEGAWAITCFYVTRAFRGHGLMHALTAAAVDYARARGATRIDAFPLSSDKPVAATFAYVGTSTVFRKAGFRRRSTPTARYVLDLREP